MEKGCWMREDLAFCLEREAKRLFSDDEMNEELKPSFE